MLRLEELKQTDQKGNLLVHCCCAPCSSAVLERLVPFFNTDVYYYNPNIQPEQEFNKRASEEVRFVSEAYPSKVRVITAEYHPEEFDRIAKGRENLPERGERCYDCYYLRMKNSALYAKENGYDCFTTSLSVSPHKVASWINEIGKQLEETLGIEFLYSDFKKKDGYKRSIELSKLYGLYRQDYCGCIYSKKNKENL